MSYILQIPVKEFLAKEKHFNFIEGNLIESTSTASIAIQNPATEEVIGHVADSNATDVENALKSAQKGLIVWQKYTPAQREKCLLNYANIIESQALNIAELLVLEQGKLLKDAQGEVAACVASFRYYAGWATKIEGSTLDVSLTAPNTDFFAYTKREAIGIVAAITPWNVPVMMFGWKIAPALACGCVVVLKPSEFTPLTSLWLAKLAIEAGIPAGVVNVITGYGHTTGDILVKHPLVNKISFTGSVATGKIIQRNASENLSRVTLELGGKNPIIVMPDANIAKAVTGIARGMIYNQGQVCVSGSRVYIHRTIYDKVVADVAAIFAKTVIAEGFDPQAGMGPMVSENHYKKVLNYINITEKEGILPVIGGKKANTQGYFIEPTLYANTQNKPLTIVKEEIFGPILVAMPFDDIQEVLAYANDSPCGLSASIYTENLSQAQQLIKQIQAGVVYVNSPVRSDNNLPLGGFKQSGIGRELGRSAIEQYTEIKSVCIAY